MSHAAGQGDIVVVVGSPGAGKTLAISDALTYEARDGGRLVLLDLTGDLCTYLAPDVVPARVATVAEAAKAGGHLAFVERPGVPLDAIAEAWASYCARLHKPGDVLVCDEAEFVFPNKPLPDTALRIVKLARNWGVRVYAAGQRPQYLSTLLRSNATHVAVFAADSLAYVEGCKEFGDPELFARARSLPKHHYLYRARSASAPLPVFNSRRESAPWLASR